MKAVHLVSLYLPSLLSVHLFDKPKFKPYAIDAPKKGKETRVGSPLHIATLRNQISKLSTLIPNSCNPIRIGYTWHCIA